jgi:diguanylate cyclase (GGDEF)-like protein/PAS domain S-box-containing protein
MSLPRLARLAICGVVLGGLLTLGLAVRDVLQRGVPGRSQVVLALALGALVLLSWLKPLVVYVGANSATSHVDESLLVFLLLAVEPGLVVITFALAMLVAQVAIRRNPVKLLYNFGQVTLAVGAAATVFNVLAERSKSFSWVDVGGALLGAATYLVVSTALLAALMRAMRTPWRPGTGIGIKTWLLVNFGGASVAVGGAFLSATYPAALPLTVLPLLVLRYALAGMFRAHHDRTRLEGLFAATLEANGSLGQERGVVVSRLLESARRLLRCSDAALVERPRSSDAMAAEVSLLGESRWLAVSGRSRTEPFDSADQALLDALAAVGTTALSNAGLYERSRSQKQRLAAITSSLGEGVCALSGSGRITFVNRAAATMLGWGTTEGLDDERLLTDPDAGMPAPGFLLALAGRTIATGETVTTYDDRFTRSDGGFVDVACTVAPIIENGEPVGAVLVFRDISEEKQLNEQLRHQALHDALTGLPNRRQFLGDLSDALERARSSGTRHTVLFADIDRFKLINDSLGHHAGDLLIVSIAERIRNVLRKGDVLARFGGDEFTILLEGVGTIGQATEVAQRLLDAMGEPIRLPDGHEIVASLSIGIAVTSSGSNGDDVLHDADVAMYQAKTSGRSGAYCVFDVDAMGMRSAERIELELDLRHALEHEELDVHYQPLFSVFDRRIVGVEALVRWNHPTRGMLPPELFIGIAEETGLILELGRLVLEKACRQARDWQERIGATFPVGVNLSPRQFQDPGLLASVEQVIASTGVDPSQLCLEITESLAMHHLDQTTDVLHALKDLGVSLAIDDFGTGHSALRYLALFPIQHVKVDRSFVEGVEDDPVKSAIISAVLMMASAIKATTIIEGVETESELEHLRALGCSVVQGYLLARPMPAKELEQLVVSTPAREMAVAANIALANNAGSTIRRAV